MIRFKSGVRLTDLSPQMVFAAMVVDSVYTKHGIMDCVVTSGNDSKHMATSWHYRGRALDFRTRNVPPLHRNSVAQEIGVSLGENYDVVLEATHLHVEFDPKEHNDDREKTA